MRASAQGAGPGRDDRVATGARPLANPYVAGVGIGLVLVLSYLVLGTGLGASGAIHRVAVVAARAVAPDFVAAAPPLAVVAAEPAPLSDYLLVLLLGTFLGGLISALASGRMQGGIERGPRSSPGRRLVLAFLGGSLVGMGSRLAGGCTSGLALSGGALLQGGAFLFIASTFAAGYLVAPLVRREWLP
jgi:uncharacterized membrane protein YedE/YeeE